MPFRIPIVVLALSFCLPAASKAQEADGVTALLSHVEKIALAGDSAAFFTLLTSGASRDRAVDFAGSELIPGGVRAVLKERDRAPLRGTLAGNGYSLIVDVLVEFGPRARASTWRLDVKRVGDAGSDREWGIDDEERLS